MASKSSRVIKIHLYLRMLEPFYNKALSCLNKFTVSIIYAVSPLALAIGFNARFHHLLLNK
jgi:hypothetical protein